MCVCESACVGSDVDGCERLFTCCIPLCICDVDSQELQQDMIKPDAQDHRNHVFLTIGLIPNQAMGIGSLWFIHFPWTHKMETNVLFGATSRLFLKSRISLGKKGMTGWNLCKNLLQLEQTGWI